MPSDPPDLVRAQYVSLATFRRTGAEVRTPVWLAGEGATFYAFSEGAAGKVKRIRANGRARMAACTFGGRVTSGWVDARARILKEPHEISSAYRALYRKYGWRVGIADAFSKLTGRYGRRAVLAFTLEGA